jgi:hypothetical protein
MDINNKDAENARMQKTQRCKKRKDAKTQKMRGGSESCHPAFFLYIIL